MRRGRILIFLVLIVVIGLALLYFAFTQFGGLTGVVPPTPAALTEVYFAAQNIPQGTIITQEMLGTFSLPPENVAEVMFTVGEEGALIGQTARFSLDQGVVITSSMVGTGPVEISGPAWAVQIPSGMVAAAIPTNRLALVGYGVNDGAHVNVNACMLFVDMILLKLSFHFTAVLTGALQPGNIPLSMGAVMVERRPGRDVSSIQPFNNPSMQCRRAQRPRLVCQMILQDVVVLKLGTFGIQAAPADPNATPSPAQQQQANPDIVTLMVTPQDSISLNYFVYSGAQLTMSLRNPNDTSRFAAESATLTSLLTQYNISLPSKLPYGVQPRVDVLVPPLLNNPPAQPQQ
jgi:pilus assembly protein CpaB